MGLLIAFGFACIVLVVWLVWKALNWVWFQPKKLEKQLFKEQGLKGSPYRLLFGDIKDTFRMRNEAREKPIPFTHDFFSRISPFLHQHVQIYGDNSVSWLGPNPIITTSDPELIRDAWTRMNEFRKPKFNPLIALLAPGLVRYEGEKWARHRKIINPAFHVEKLKLMLPAFRLSIIELINKWDKMSSETRIEVDVCPYIVSLSADVISRAAFGSSYEEGRKIFELLKEQSECVLRLFQSVYIPGWKYVPTKTNKKMKQLNTDIENSLKKIIDKRRKAMEAGEVAKDDLLGILLDSNFKESQNNGSSNKKQLAMSFEEMMDECKLFFFAGQETTSVLLIWAMILLSKHQDWQTRAREEVLATFGKNEPNFDGLHHLKIMTMILYEVLRLYPPVVSITRKVYDDDIKLGKLCVPRGTMVGLSILQTHNDPRIWGNDATEFKPDRFSEGIAKATNGNNSFFPFGWGPRICIGQNFAMVEAKLAMAMFLQRFSFELSPSYTHAPTTVITLHPQFGAHLILNQIKDSNDAI